MSRRTQVIVAILAAAALLASPGYVQERPSSHPAFSDGFRDYKEGKWREAVINMWRAQENWSEDGERTRTYGRWPEPYLPLYYLGVALYELGCYRQALEQFDLSVLSKREIRGAKTERERLVELRKDCESRINSDVYEEPEECLEWPEWGKVENDEDDDQNS